MGLLWAFLIFGLVVFIHEFGHFLVAKMVKSPVYKFSIGMGPSILSKKIGETEYSLSILPLGGFVQLETEEELESENGSAFSKLHPLKKIAIFFAGPLFNFIFAFIIICGLLFTSGYPTTTIGEIQPDSPSSKAGLMVGDIITRIDNKDISSWNDVLNSIISNNSKDLDIKVKRDNKIHSISLKTELSEDGVNYKIGIAPMYKKDLFRSINIGFKSTIENIRLTFEGFKEAIKGIFIKNTSDVQDEPVAELTGPIGMINIMAKESSNGVSSIISILISISISLGVCNLVPVPIFDGGRICISLLELARGGKKLTEKQEVAISMVGIAIVLGLVVFTTFKDISNLFN